MKKRNFGDVLAEIVDGEPSLFVCTRAHISLRAAEELTENLKSATAWIRDQQRQKAEQDTPELPL